MPPPPAPAPPPLGSNPPPPPPPPPPPKPPSPPLYIDAAPPAPSEEPDRPRSRQGPLYANFAVPEMPARKTRTPKMVQKGLEAAFRKRQNQTFKKEKEAVLGLLRRVLDTECGTEGEVCELFRDVSEKLTSLGLTLGGSEDWADRLYIEDKKGALLFSDDELDVAEAAQKRMELMYNVDAWAVQLAWRTR